MNKGILAPMASSFIVIVLSRNGNQDTDLAQAGFALFGMFVILSIVADSTGSSVPRAIAWFVFLAILLGRGIDALANVTAGNRRRGMKSVQGGKA